MLKQCLCPVTVQVEREEEWGAEGDSSDELEELKSSSGSGNSADSALVAVCVPSNVGGRLRGEGIE